MNRFIALLATAMACVSCAVAEEGADAVAWLDPDRSAIVDRSDGVDLLLALSQPVPYRITLLDGPPRLVLDFRSVDFEWLYTGDLGESEAILAVRHGEIEAGWSRMVLDLSGPYVVSSAQMQGGAEAGTARLEIALGKTDPTTFATRAGRGSASERIDPGFGRP